MTDARIPLDHLTSDALDALYDERDRLRQELDDAYRRYDSRDAAEYAFGPLIDRPFRSLRAKQATVGQPFTQEQAAAVQAANLPLGTRVTRAVVEEALAKTTPGCGCTYGQRCPNCRD